MLKRKTPLKSRTPLRRRTPLRSRSALGSGSGLARRTPLRSVGRRRKSTAYQDRKSMAEYRLTHPFCLLCCQPSSKLHHILFGQWGRDMVVSNYAMLCRSCNDDAHSVRAMAVRTELIAAKQELGEWDGDWASAKGFSVEGRAVR